MSSDELSTHGDRRAIVLAADDGYAEPLAVTLRSLSETQRHPELLEVYVLDCGMSPRNLQRVRASVPAIDVSVVPVEQHLLHGLPVIHYYTPAMWARLFAAVLLPPHVERVLYLDADVLVRTDLEPLWSMDMGGYVAAACIDSVLPVVGSALKAWKDMGLDPTLPYLNSGVLVMDLQHWRGSRIAERSLEIVERFGPTLAMPDQDAINAVLAGDFLVLPQRWNQMAKLRRNEHVAHTFASRSEIDTALDDPAIMHFNGMKPWIRECNDPGAAWWVAVHEHTAFHPLKLRALRDYDRPFAIPVRLKGAARRFLSHRRLPSYRRT